MIPVNRENLRDALIAATVGIALAWLLSGCAGQPQPPPTTTAAELTQVATPAPKVTGVRILAQQPPEVQQAITRHAQDARWPSFHVGRSQTAQS
jgi:Flp pilus assembly protein TadD